MVILQACVATNRVLVHESIYDKFSEMLATAVKTQLVSGDGFDPAVNQGPLINEQQFRKVDGIVKDAVSKGARLVTGGGVDPILKGRFYQPTVLGNITENMNIYNEEIFGPVCPLYKYSLLLSLPETPVTSFYFCLPAVTDSTRKMKLSP